ncbi:GAF and ANTAR domain-containing protein [Rathayibacter sp. YIM 133350]|uniref:GAF and ANTAR domain-containing protein n=1 Tax=Rathayibacter sp. YIM 133350 TaxID=3131992 RepID=UPI00307E11D9
MGSERERQLVETFVSLADTLVADYDPVEVLQMLVERCVSLLDVTDAGILLDDGRDGLKVAAATSSRSESVELIELSFSEGPCVEAYRTGTTLSVPNIASLYAQWPRFATAAGQMGYQAVHAIPMRLRDTTIGSLDLLHDAPGKISEEDLTVARALVEVATISILQGRIADESAISRDQLQKALESRVAIEQAKGVIAQAEGIGVNDAFLKLRAHARAARRLLTEVARDVVENGWVVGG